MQMKHLEQFPFFNEWYLLVMLRLMEEEWENAADSSFLIFFFSGVCIDVFTEAFLHYFWKDKHVTEQ